MKRLALLLIVALGSAATVFAPVAMAQAPGEIDIQSVTLEQGGWVTVTGTVECVEGHYYQGGVVVRQRSTGNVYNETQMDISRSTCETTGPQAFTATQYESSRKAFHRGPSAVLVSIYLCPPDHPGPYFHCENTQAIEAIHIR
jgi:hypothetical protein